MKNSFLVLDLAYSFINRNSRAQKNLPNLRSVESDSSFYWREIKDEFIPFFEMLDIKYEVCGTFNKSWIPSYQKDIVDELVVDFETPMFITQHTHFFYDRSKLLSGRTTRKKIKNITIYVKLK